MSEKLRASKWELHAGLTKDHRPNWKPNWTVIRGGLIGEAWIKRFSGRSKTSGGFFADYNFQDREIYFSVRRSKQVIATGALKIWRGVYTKDGGCYDLQGFVDRANEYSFNEFTTAQEIARIWSGDDVDEWAYEMAPFEYGDLCFFDRLVIDAKTAADVEAVWQTIDALFTHIRHGVAALVLKAFPLEYEGSGDAEGPAFERRRRAMMRLYQRRLDVTPVPHKELASEGWMLRTFNDGAQPDGGL